MVARAWVSPVRIPICQAKAAPRPFRRAAGAAFGAKAKRMKSIASRSSAAHPTVFRWFGLVLGVALAAGVAVVGDALVVRITHS